MIPVNAYAAKDAQSPVAPYKFERRDPKPKDVVVEILYCGVCHTDIHFVRNDLGISVYPLVPGHEIVGRVLQTGNQVTKFKAGDRVGVGCLVDSCRECACCSKGLEQYCLNGATYTYGVYEKDGKTISQGGYSTKIVVDEYFVVKIADTLPLEKTAPLLCAGITTYSPIKYWKIGKGHKVGIVGLGGLGHMAIKFAVSFGAEVTVLSTSPSKEADAKKLGAHHFVLTTDEEQVKKVVNHFDFIIDTVAAAHDYNKYVELLTISGVLIILGVSPEPMTLGPVHMIFTRKSVAGSLIGGLPETQEMMDYCAQHNITSDIELIPIQKINEAYERMLKGDIKYRFVIDIASLKE
jgi:alcohol dehydrogenase (NADP+)